MATSANISASPEALGPQSEAAEPRRSPREPKTFAVTLSYELAVKLHALAEREGRAVSEILAEAFQEYYGEFVFRSLKEVREYASTRNPYGYTEEDIPRLIKEVRAEQAAEEAALQTAKES